MLFFRSEEAVAAWCSQHRLEQGPLVTLGRLWGLAVTWYASRLEADSRRPKPEEMRRIFTGLGLEGDFWDPTADVFGT